MPSYSRTRNGKQWSVRWRVRNPRPGEPTQPYKTDPSWTTKRAAQDWYEEHVAGKSAHSSSNTKLADYLDTWLAGIQREPATLRLYRYAIISIAASLGTIKLRDLTRADIRAWHADMRSRGYKPATIVTYHAVLTGALSRAVEDELLYRNPAARLSIEGSDKAPRPHWEPPHSAHFLDATEGDWTALPYRIMLLTGIRPGECRALCWSDLSLERATVSIPDAKTPAGVRTVAMPESLSSDLQKFRIVQKQRRLQAISWTDHDCVITSPRRAGYPVSMSYLLTNLKRYCEMLDLPVISPHGLRHSYASWMAALGVHPLVVQQALGHRSVGLTLDVYSHVSEGMTRQAAQALDDALNDDRATSEYSERLS